MKKPYPKNRDSSARRLTHEQFLERFYKVRKDQLIVLSKYHLMRDKMKFRCKICNNEFYSRADAILKKSNKNCCPFCGQKNRNATIRRKNKNNNLEFLKNEIKMMYPDNKYELDIEKSSYINNKANTLAFKCNSCGNITFKSLVNIRAGKGCPICNKIIKQESKNVRKIKEFLDSENIQYQVEYKIPECKHIYPLPFDFAFIINNSLRLVEYDGEFHDKGYNNNTESQAKVKLNDSIKTNYCLTNNIPLLRLRYNDFKNYKEKILKFLSV